jgi:hypothetical protein
MKQYGNKLLLTSLITGLQEESVPVVPDQLVQGNVVLLKPLQHTSQQVTAQYSTTG